MHTKGKIQIRIRVHMEPDLEEMAGHLDVAGRRALGRKLYRYSRQLFVSANIIEKDMAPKPKRGLRPIPEIKLKHN